MRILSDFDGVWTDQADEARFINRCFAHAAAPHVGIGPEDAEADFGAFLERTHAQPHEHGWWPRGFLTAFVDEDELLATGAVCQWLDTGGEHPQADRWRAGIHRAGYESAHDFGSAQFEPAMRAFRRQEGHRLVAESRDVCEALRAAGVDLILVSNSPTDKLRSMFAEIGVSPGDGVRFVGDARKWWIVDPEPMHGVAGRRVHLDRPFYREIVARERPDLVVGDVASLDLSVPASLRWEGALEADARLVLRQGARSSPWALGQVTLSKGERLVDDVIHSITDLVRIVEGA